MFVDLLDACLSVSFQISWRIKLNSFPEKFEAEVNKETTTVNSSIQPVVLRARPSPTDKDKITILIYLCIQRARPSCHSAIEKIFGSFPLLPIPSFYCPAVVKRFLAYCSHQEGLETLYSLKCYVTFFFFFACNRFQYRAKMKILLLCVSMFPCSLFLSRYFIENRFSYFFSLLLLSMSFSLTNKFFEIMMWFHAEVV